MMENDNEDESEKEIEASCSQKVVEDDEQTHDTDQSVSNITEQNKQSGKETNAEEDNSMESGDPEVKFVKRSEPPTNSNDSTLIDPCRTQVKKKKKKKKFDPHKRTATYSPPP